ncbi:MAG: DJ-1/PfpI family protein [Nanoarchaeota archaeon]
MVKIKMRALFIVAQDGYQDYEYGAPKSILEKAGIQVITASKKAGICKGKLGGTTKAEISLSEVNVSEYDAVVFVGGPGAVVYQHDAQAHLIAQEAVKEGKVLAAICIAPAILAYAGVLKGKKATVWNEDGGQKDVLEKNGAKYVAESVVTDGRIVTASGPPAAEQFGKAVLQLLKAR